MLSYYIQVFLWVGCGRENSAYMLHMMCLRNVLYGHVGVTCVCVVGANDSVCAVSGENGVFLIFGPRWFRAILFLFVVRAFRRSVEDSSCSSLLFCIGAFLRFGVLFMKLFLGFLLKCSFVAYIDVVLYPVVLLGMDSIPS
jgi:hypothetical protein